MPTQVLTMLDLSASERLVYVALCAHANERAECYPARATIESFTGLSLRTISAALGALVEKGIIAREERTGTTPLYIVLPLRELQEASVPETKTEREGKTLANIARGTPLEAPSPHVEKFALAKKVKRLFFETFEGHGLGRAADVQRFIYDSGKDFGWYSALFERASKLPFLRGENARGVKMPLSFILREGDNILNHGKYAPWKDKAAQVASYIKQGGAIKDGKHN